MYTIEEIQREIDERDLLQNKMDTFEVDPDDYEEAYNDMLDDVYPEFMGMYSASYTLLQVDPTAYRCGLLDYVDNLEISYPSNWDDDMDDIVSNIENMINESIEELEEEIQELEDELEELDGDDFEYKKEIERLKDLINSYIELR